MSKLERVIIPEILDSLDPADPRAVRSRWDLRWIDFYLGNSRWIVRQLKGRISGPARIMEIGAGEGSLCRKVHAALPSSRVTGLDLVTRPPGLPPAIDWRCGDFFQTLGDTEAEACVGSLILHHFSDAALRELGERLQSFRLIVFCEPLRARLPLFLSKLSNPFVGEVTRHDMPASIRAGFRPGEMPALMGLDSKKWIIRELSHWRGSLRLVASRR
jgi:hypothetical protein